MMVIGQDTSDMVHEPHFNHACLCHGFRMTMLSSPRNLKGTVQRLSFDPTVLTIIRIPHREIMIHTFIHVQTTMRMK